MHLTLDSTLLLLFLLFPTQIKSYCNGSSCCGCPDLFLPVCGADGRTYMNYCSANCAGVPVAFQGPCNGYYGNSCAYNCPLTNLAPVCGVNGITYANSCFCSCYGIQNYYGGSCGPLNPYPNQCGGVASLCCGSDYRTYYSPCAAASAGVYVVHYGNCMLNSAYGYYNSAAQSTFLNICSPNIYSNVIGAPTYLTGNSAVLTYSQPVTSGSYFYTPIAASAPYCPYQYANQGYASGGYMFCLPGVNYLPQAPLIGSPLGYSNCPDPNAVLNWMYPGGAGCPFNYGNYGFASGYFANNVASPTFNCFVPYNPASYYGAGAVAQQVVYAQAPAQQVVYVQQAQAAAPQQQVIYVQQAGAVSQTTASTQPNIVYVQQQASQSIAAQPRIVYVQPVSTSGDAKLMTQSGKVAYARYLQSKDSFPSAHSKIFRSHSARKLQASSTVTVDQMSQGVAGLIPADMAEKLAKAPYVYYTYFYTIVYYKIAKPETLVQGVAIKDIMYYISEYLIKMKPKPVDQSQVSIFEKSIGMEFDVNQSFDIVNNILNEISVCGTAMGVGPSSSDAVSYQSTTVSDTSSSSSATAQPVSGPITNPDAAVQATQTFAQASSVSSSSSDQQNLLNLPSPQSLFGSATQTSSYGSLN